MKKVVLILCMIFCLTACFTKTDEEKFDKSKNMSISKSTELGVAGKGYTGSYSSSSDNSLGLYPQLGDENLSGESDADL